MSRLPPVVIDNGTGYTKMGYAGNNDPQFILPTLIATRENAASNRVNKRGTRAFLPILFDFDRIQASFVSLSFLHSAF